MSWRREIVSVNKGNRSNLDIARDIGRNMQDTAAKIEAIDNEIRQCEQGEMQQSQEEIQRKRDARVTLVERCKADVTALTKIANEGI